jgi:integrase
MGWVKGGWIGGKVWRKQNGQHTYWIYRKINGRGYVKKTPAGTVKVAMEWLARFEADPDGYDATGGLKGERVLLDDTTIEGFRKWQAETQKNSPTYVSNLVRHLRWWAERLKGRDMRRLQLRADIMRVLGQTTDRNSAIKSIKAFYSWCRKVEFSVKAAEDPTLQTLTAPQSKPAQWKKTKVIPWESHLKVVTTIREPYRWSLQILAATGWHVTEVRQLALAGSVEPLPASTPGLHGTTHVLVCPRRKSGEPQRTAVTAEVAEAANRLIRHGGLCLIDFYRAVKEAQKAAGVEPYGPGQYRHSIGTWAISQGADPKAVAAFLGHRSVQTLRRFYSVHATVPAVPVPGAVPAAPAPGGVVAPSP